VREGRSKFWILERRELVEKGGDGEKEDWSARWVGE
jgi:hypothetical protein